MSGAGHFFIIAHGKESACFIDDDDVSVFKEDFHSLWFVFLRRTFELFMVFRHGFLIGVGRILEICESIMLFSSLGDR